MLAFVVGHLALAEIAQLQGMPDTPMLMRKSRLKAETADRAICASAWTIETLIGTYENPILHSDGHLPIAVKSDFHVSRCRRNYPLS